MMQVILLFINSKQGKDIDNFTKKSHEMWQTE